MKKLKPRAGRNGPRGKRTSLKEYLLKMPDVGPDAVFGRAQDTGRKVLLSKASHGIGK
jgi:hypothetical protein